MTLFILGFAAAHLFWVILISLGAAYQIRRWKQIDARIERQARAAHIEEYRRTQLRLRLEREEIERLERMYSAGSEAGTGDL